MIAGNAICGGGAGLGEIVGVRVNTSAVSADVYFRHVGGPEGARLALYLDGELVSLVDSLGGEEQRATIPATLIPGKHRLEIVPIPVDQRGVAGLRGGQYGRRVILAWPRATAGDAREYRVFRGATAGAEPGGDPVAVIRGTEVEELLARSMGNGRLSVWGAWEGAEVNEEFTIEGDGAGRFRENVGGELSGWQAIEAGVTISLGNGVQVRFHDAPAAYSGSVTFFVGPRNWWRSEELAEGSWQWGVRAVDAAGNVGAMLGPFAVAVVHLPDGPVDVKATFDPGATEAVRVSWELPTGTFAGVDVYSNFSGIFGELREDVIEDGPWLELAGDAEEFAFTPGVNGLWRFWVRTRDALGRRSDDGVVVEVDTTGIKTGVALNVPEQLEGRQGPGGVAVISWAYAARFGDGLTGFRVYVHEDPEAPTFVTPAATISATIRSGVERFSWTSGALAGTRGFTVRAVAGAVETTNDDVVVVVPDAVAPTLSGEIQGATV